jgi:threonyl-tRNA synthetase
MSSITVTLPDGSKHQFPSGVRPLDIARSISRRLADDAIVARVDGELIDLTRPLTSDTTLQLLTSKDPEALEVYRHSTAHLMAAAVLELYPETKLGVGPPVENGFYYDFQRDSPFTPEDLEKIEAKMWELQANDLPYERKLTPKPDGLAKYAQMGEQMKRELIAEKAGDVFSEYTLGPHFIDFCRGPHVPSTARIKAFKLLSIAGAYWKGDEKNHQMQRIYGTAFFTRKDLEEYLRKLEEAKKRDHRKLGQELDLFSVQELAGPGLIFFHPKGGIVRKILEDWMRDQYLARGYSLVYTPHVARAELWKTSGHYNFYGENMFKRMELDDAEYQLKPMNCPFHILIYKDRMRSYRDLPVRLGELGTVYRYERSGVLHGLSRVRGFTQDDAHIFCRFDQLEDEVAGVLDLALFMVDTFGFKNYSVYLSTRPEKYAGELKVWEQATDTLAKALERQKLKYEIDPGEGVFYGPKIDIKFEDAVGRGWQGPTIQVDFNLPQRFDVNYVGEDGQEHMVAMVHRTVLGSMERFLASLIEHYGGAFPVWLAPVQAVLIPIADRHLEYARKLEAELKKEGIRVNMKIRQAQMEKVPYMLVVGDREVADSTVSVRLRSGEQAKAQSFADFKKKIKGIIASRSLELRL